MSMRTRRAAPSALPCSGLQALWGVLPCARGLRRVCELPPPASCLVLGLLFPDLQPPPPRAARRTPVLFPPSSELLRGVSGLHRRELPPPASCLVLGLLFP